jgi:hypothetical protein
MECIIETKASMLLQFIDGLRGDVRVTFEEGTWGIEENSSILVPIPMGARWSAFATVTTPSGVMPAQRQVGLP